MSLSQAAFSRGRPPRAPPHAAARPVPLRQAVQCSTAQSVHGRLTRLASAAACLLCSRDCRSMSGAPIAKAPAHAAAHGRRPAAAAGAGGRTGNFAANGTIRAFVNAHNAAVVDPGTVLGFACSGRTARLRQSLCCRTRAPPSVDSRPRFQDHTRIRRVHTWGRDCVDPCDNSRRACSAPGKPCEPRHNDGAHLPAPRPRVPARGGRGLWHGLRPRPRGAPPARAPRPPSGSIIIARTRSNGRSVGSVTRRESGPPQCTVSPGAHEGGAGRGGSALINGLVILLWLAGPRHRRWWPP